MEKVLCFGELLLRLSPDVKGEWMTNNVIPVFIGGAELNVATALAKWEMQVGYCTVLPDNFLTLQLLKMIGDKNIDTSTVILKGNKIGIYYLPQGTELKNAGVIYDRSNSSFSDLEIGEIDWEKILDGITWFHFSAICPAVSQKIADVCEEALQVCVQKNIKISIDLNYRSKLWQYGKHPNEVMPELVQYCDLVMGNVWAAEVMLNIPVHPNLRQVNTKALYLNQAKETSQNILLQFPKCKSIANTYRFDEDGIQYYGTLYSEDVMYVSPEHKGKSVVDKVGSGDCFMAGLIYGHLHQLPAQQVIDLASAASFQKLFIKGDSINKTIEEIQSV